MAHRTHVCKHCKTRSEEAKKFGLSYFCDPHCATQYAINKSRKDKKKALDNKRKAIKKTFKANDIKTRRNAAKVACHEYIRLRDKGDPCICCGEPLDDVYHAGHYLPSGQNSNVRYNENNIHGQRVNCNYFKGGDSGDYAKNLIKKIGVFEYYCIKLNTGGTNKRTAKDYREIELHYRQKKKELEKSR